jgi:hypothetical protein
VKYIFLLCQEINALSGYLDQLFPDHELKRFVKMLLAEDRSFSDYFAISGPTRKDDGSSDYKPARFADILKPDIRQNLLLSAERLRIYPDNWSLKGYRSISLPCWGTEAVTVTASGITKPYDQRDGGLAVVIVAIALLEGYDGLELGDGPLGKIISKEEFVNHPAKDRVETLKSSLVESVKELYTRYEEEAPTSDLRERKRMMLKDIQTL